MKTASIVLIALSLLLIFSLSVSAADYQCVFRNAGQTNCNAVQAGNTFCATAMTAVGTTQFGSAVTCTNNAPAGNGSITCQLSHSGAASQVRCSNTTYFQSGPTVVGGSQGSCTYNDCELNQISCASGNAYQQCVPDATSPGCNKWQPTLCVASAPCYANTNAQLATCVGVPATEITTQGGVYFRTSSGSNDDDDSDSDDNDNDNDDDSDDDDSSNSCYTVNGKTYCIVTSTDSAKDTGKEVCESMGKTCVGYTNFDNSVCKYFHPSASETQSVNGSKSGFYCNGAPQTGLACASAMNNCQVCPQCNVNVTCDEPIGGLFREMYVECVATNDQDSDNAAASFTELGNFLVTLFKDETIKAKITTSAGQDTFGCIKVQNPPQMLASECVGATMWFNANQTAMTAIQNASDKKAAFLAQKAAGNITYGSNNFFLSIKIFFLELFAGLFGG